MQSLFGVHCSHIQTLKMFSRAEVKRKALFSHEGRIKFLFLKTKFPRVT